MPDVDAEKARQAFEALALDCRQDEQVFSGDTKPVIMVGTATCGRSAGALEVLQAFSHELSSAGLDAKVMEVGCMGHCYAEPMAVVKRPGYPPLVYHHLTPILARNIVKHFFQGEDPLFEYLLGAVEPNEMGIPSLSELPRFGKEQRRLLARCGLYDPDNIRSGIAHGAYAGLIQALQMTPTDIIQKVRDAGLRGLGGAGFPVWRKWQMALEQPAGEKYVICNGDEGDPGAFMDRTIIESDPHALIEGMLIAARATGASQGTIYVRAEYPLAVRRLRTALEQARGTRLLGADILGSGMRFQLDIVRGAGAFVCGESTALMRSIEGKRGMPRVRPPHSAQCGLFCRPTVLNNVKTLASLAPILLEGPAAFTRQGTETSKGTAVFALAGKIANPGLVEVPMGTSLRDLIFDIGGGVPNGKQFKAVQIGGPSGGCLPESTLDTPIDFDALNDAGAMMGSGGLVVLDEDNCMVETARFFLQFTQTESCGKCTFCRIGTRHMLDLLEGIVAGRGEMKDLDRLQELAEDIQAGSLCGLGKTAPNPVLTTLRFFRDEYVAHIQKQTCPARVCNALMTYYILPDKCARGCDACVGSCPVEAIYTTNRRIKAIDQSLCVKCDSCVAACPPEYDAVVKISPLSQVPPTEPRPKKKEP